jgi:hypothetical protein
VSTVERGAFDALERDLRRALAWEPSPAALTRMDRQVAARVAIPGAQLEQPTTRTLPRRRVLILAFAALLLMGAAAAATLLQQAVSLDPRWRTAVDLAERLHLSQTIDGYTVRLERAYADPNELVLVTSLAGPSNSFVASSQLDVVDAQGRTYLAITDANATESTTGSGASVHAFQVPPGVSGPLDLTVTVEPLKSEPLHDLSSPPAWFSLPTEVWPAKEPGLVGPWVFHLNLPLRSAVFLTPNQTVTAAQVPITLRQVTITPTSIRVRLDPDLSAPAVADGSKWTVDAVIQQGSAAAHDLAWTPAGPDWTGQPVGPELRAILERGEDGSVFVRQTAGGTDQPSGHWRLIIRRLTGAANCVSGSPWLPCEDPGATTEIDGPWVFTFDVP